MSTQITYKGSTIASFSNDTKTLNTSGKYMEDDVVVTESISLQSKTATPTESTQTIVPGTGYEGLSQVTVGAISSNYVGSNIPVRTASDLTTSASTITTPAGYYSGAVSKSIEAGTATTPATTITTNPAISVNTSTGLITASYSGSSNVTPTIVSGYVSQGTAGKISTAGNVTYQLTSQPAQTITPTTSNQTIASGTYLTGSQTILGDINLVPSNIKSGVSIFGVQGNIEGGNTFIQDEEDIHGGTIRTITTNQMVSGISVITSNGLHTVASFYSASVNVMPNLQSKSVNPSETAQTITPDSNYDGLSQVSVGAISSTYVGSNVPRKSSADLTASGSTITVPSGYYSSQATKSIASGTAGTPTATKGTVNNHSVSVTPSVTNTAGYIAGGTKTGTAVTVSASELVSGTLSITSSGTKDVTNYAYVSVPSGTAGTPTATKGTVTNHAVSVTPTVTNTGGYISGSTNTGTAVTVSASELVSGTMSITENGTGIDVTNYASVDVAVSEPPVTHTATIVQGVSSRTNIKYDSHVYMSTGATFEFSAGDTCELEAYGEMGGGHIVEDGVIIGSTDHLSPYTYTLPDCDVEFVLTTNGGGSISVTKLDNIDPITITENGTYTASGTTKGYSPITVSVAGIGITIDKIATRAIGENITGSVSYIGSAAFAYCTMQTVSFPNVKTLSSYAFSGCYFLTTASFPEASYISNAAFMGCAHLSDISFPKVSTIGQSAFYNCSSLTTASFSKATTIGAYAFAFCSSLTTISFPEVTTINTSAFWACSSLTTASFSKATTIYAYAFTYCTSLTTISFPEITTIGSNAFQSCTNLTTANFPKATAINSSAFRYCSSLTTISFPSATAIGGSAFQYCSSLTTANFPLATSIGAYAFYNCYSLSIVSFPLVTTIGNYAFDNCYNLLSVYLLGSSLCTNGGVFAFANTPIAGNTTSTGGVYGSIFVPSSLYDSYISAANWSLYSARFVSLTDAEIEAL